MSSWYFAYGSNLSSEQMIARTGRGESEELPPRRAILPHFRLVFQSLAFGGPAFANVLSPGDGVLGVVYRCSTIALQRLDKFEDGYERRPIQVLDEQGAILEAEAFVISPPALSGEGRPAAEYLKTIVDGARQHGLPESYIRDVLAIATQAG